MISKKRHDYIVICLISCLVAAINGNRKIPTTSIKGGKVFIKEQNGKAMRTDCQKVHSLKVWTNPKKVRCNEDFSYSTVYLYGGTPRLDCYSATLEVNKIVEDLTVGYTTYWNSTHAWMLTPVPVDDGMCDLTGTDGDVVCQSYSVDGGTKVNCSNEFVGVYPYLLSLSSGQRAVSANWLPMKISVEMADVSPPRRSRRSIEYDRAVQRYFNWRFPKETLEFMARKRGGGWWYGACRVGKRYFDMLTGTCEDLEFKGLGRITLSAYHMFYYVSDSASEEICATGFIGILAQSQAKCESYFANEVNKAARKGILDISTSNKMVLDKHNVILTNLNEDGKERTKKINQVVARANANQGQIFVNSNNIKKIGAAVKNLVEFNKKGHSSLMMLRNSLKLIGDRTMETEGKLQIIDEAVAKISSRLGIEYNRVTESNDTKMKFEYPDLGDELLLKLDLLNDSLKYLRNKQKGDINILVDRYNETKRLLNESRSELNKNGERISNYSSAQKKEQKLREKLEKETNEKFQPKKDDDDVGGLKIGKIGVGLSVAGGSSFILVLVIGGIVFLVWYCRRPSRFTVGEKVI